MAPMVISLVERYHVMTACPPDRAFSELLASLYGGLLNERPWDDFLQRLREWTDASFATLIITVPGDREPGSLIAPGADPEHSRMYIQSFFANDPFQGLPDGRVTSFHEFANRQIPEKIDAYRRYLELAGGEQVLAVDLRFGSGFEARFRLTRDVPRPDFSDAERANLQALVPHLRNAVRLFERQQLAGSRHGVFQRTTEGLGLGLVVLDRQCRVESSNALGEQILAEGEGLYLRGAEAAFTSREHQRAITALLRDEAADDVVRFRIDRPEYGDLIVTARPINLQQIHAGTSALALFLTRPTTETTPDPRSLQDLLGLTTAEARLTSVLAEGLTLVDAARKLGIAHNTAKAHLRAIFVKTGVHRQTQLMALLASLNG